MRRGVMSDTRVSTKILFVLSCLAMVPAVMIGYWRLLKQRARSWGKLRHEHNLEKRFRMLEGG